MKRVFSAGLALVFMAAMAGSIGGCGCREKVAEKVAEKAIEKAIQADAKKEGKDVDVDVNLKGGSMSIKTKDGSKKMDLNVQDGKMAVKSEGGEEQVSMNADNQSVTVTTKDGTVTSTAGKTAKIPDTFPKDIPLYAGAEIVAVSTMTQNEMFHVQATTADSLKNVAAYYKKELPAKGWTEQQTVSQAGDSPMEMLNFTKEDRTVMVMVTADQGKTAIMLQTAKNE